MAKLEKYNEKRDFEKTAEPKGAEKKRKAKKLHYVVQHHLARRDHYDFRLEWDGVLLSWAIPKGPSFNPADKRLAIRVEDHPFDYKDFEGTIPKGEYGGGTVMLWDEGYWEPIADVEVGLEEGSLKFEIFGERLKGKWGLVLIAAREGDTKDNWLLVKDKDEYARNIDGISGFTTSVRTGRTMDEIEKGEEVETLKNPFDNAGVQLARLVDTPPKGSDWLFETKYDGYRIVAYVEDGKSRLMTRNGKDYTKHFEKVAASLERFAKKRPMVLDGEMVVVDDKGKTDFQALQNYMKDKGNNEVTYAVFDILALDGDDLRNKPLIERKEILGNLLKDAPGNIYYSRHIKGNGAKNFENACAHDLEGLIAKKADSVYTGSRNGDWVKIKCGKRQEFVITGYTISDKQDDGISSVLLGYYDEEKLVFCGRAGTGFSEKDRKDMLRELKKIKRDTPAFEGKVKKSGAEEVYFVEPRLICEARFAEWTDDNLLRQASFKGMRRDKSPKDVKQEVSEEEVEMTEIIEEPKAKLRGGEIEIEGIKITNPDKVMFENPDIRKRDVVEYYARAGERMLKYAGNRILSIIRCPKGISEPCFFKKHPGSRSKNIVITPIETGSGEEEYFYIEEPKGFVYEAQMGTLEFHTWGSRVDEAEKPDVMVFDLDPDEGMPLEKVRQGVKDLRSILEKLSLKSFLKVSGGKGYHVVVPFVPSVDWETFGAFSKKIAVLMENQWPDRYTSNIRKNKRDGKIFIDWARNGRGATSVAPYSLRARKGAKVAMPISWEELDKVAPDGITMEEAVRRLSKPDPWKDFYKTKQRLK